MLSHVTCNCQLAVSFLGSLDRVTSLNAQNLMALSGTVRNLTSQTITASLGSFTSLTAAAASVTTAQCSSITEGVWSFTSMYAGTYLNPTFVGTGSSLVLQNTVGTHITLINPSGGGTNSFANFDFRGYSSPVPTNGAAMSRRPVQTARRSVEKRSPSCIQVNLAELPFEIYLLRLPEPSLEAQALSGVSAASAIVHNDIWVCEATLGCMLQGVCCRDLLEVACPGDLS